MVKSYPLIFSSTTNQASNLAKSMCHEILKEEDDEEEEEEVASLDDGADVCVNKTAHLDELLDETNGNISAKLTTLTLNDNTDTSVATCTTDTVITGLNGNNITEAANNDTNDRMGNNNNNNKSKKNKSKKAAANTKLSDSNDNKTDDDNNTSTLEANDASSSAHLMKDDVINVNA